ncbi:MAG: DUF3696 domain-containing protein [Bacteroidetes bacterium]|nr:DUF3696 domain-containing protein [Bacteroidota bacterium]
MIKKIALKNFKSFGKKQEIELKPITLLFGPNSAGKSSIWQSIVYLEGFLRSQNPDVYQTAKTFGFINFNGLKSILNRNSTDHIIDLSFVTEHFINGPTTYPYKIISKRYVSGAWHYIIEKKCTLPSFNLEVNLKFDTINNKVIHLEITFIGFAYPIMEWLVVDVRHPENIPNNPLIDWSFDPKLQRYFIGSKTDEYAIRVPLVKISDCGIPYLAYFDAYLMDLLFGLKQDKKNNYNPDKLLKGMKKNCGNFVSKVTLENYTIPFKEMDPETAKWMMNDPIFNGQYLDVLSMELPEEFIELVKTKYNYSDEQIDDLQNYFGSLFHLTQDCNFNLKSFFHQDKVLANKVQITNEPWGSPALGFDDNLAYKNLNFQLDNIEYLGYFRSVPDLNQLRIEYESPVNRSWKRVFEPRFIKEINQYLEEHFPDISYLFRINGETGEYEIIDRKTGVNVHPKSIGIGISQLMPIISSAVTNQYQLHIVEQPELHLHPSLQARVPGIFIDSFMKNENTYIIETHSEHIIRSFQLEVAKFKVSNKMKGINPDFLAIYYVTKDADGNSIIKKMELNENGDFTEPWPDDFFDSATDLTMERLKILSGSQSN